jgi:hypothetical protein
MTDRELLQQTLDTLRHLCLHTRAIKGYDGEQIQTAIDALKARLAQPENKFNPDWDAMAVMVEEQQRMAKRIEELTQREWVGLTDEELLDLADMAYANDLELLQTLQAKLKEKNT